MCNFHVTLPVVTSIDIYCTDKISVPVFNIRFLNIFRLVSQASNIPTCICVILGMNAMSNKKRCINFFGLTLFGLCIA